MDTPPGLFAFYNYICVLASRASSHHLVLATAIPPSHPGGRNKVSDPAFHAQIICDYLSPRQAKNAVTCLHFLDACRGARNLYLLLTQSISLALKAPIRSSYAAPAWPHHLAILSASTPSFPHPFYVLLRLLSSLFPIFSFTFFFIS